MLRAVREGGGAAEGEPVWAPIFAARILHFPIRSREQYARRVEVALLHEGPDPGAGKLSRLRERSESDGLDAMYAELAWDEADVEAGIRDGDLVEDSGLRDFLRLCPDPLGPAEAEPPRAVPLSPDDLERERRELELDAMAALARHARLAEVRMNAGRERLREIGAALAGDGGDGEGADGEGESAPGASQAPAGQGRRAADRASARAPTPLEPGSGARSAGCGASDAR